MSTPREPAVAGLPPDTGGPCRVMSQIGAHHSAPDALTILAAIAVAVMGFIVKRIERHSRPEGGVPKNPDPGPNPVTFGAGRGNGPVTR